MGRKPRPRILVAERDPFMQEALSLTLGNEFTLEFAPDGLEVLKRARSNPPELIILELLLPKLDGLQVLHELKDDPRTRDVPVLVFTLLVGRERALRAGADAYMRKPLHEVKLKHLVRQLVSRETHTYER